MQGASQTWALTCLVLFYQAVKKQLHGHRPLLKFVSIKLVVFFTWYQGFLIYVVKSMDSSFLKKYHVDISNSESHVETSTVRSYW